MNNHTSSTAPLLSIVVPLYNEELVIDTMYEKLTSVMAENDILDYEIVMINDGSRDATEMKAKAICSKDEKVKLISFSRNFGHQIAITAGMDKTRGRAVVIIDADLQDPPEVIIEMLKKWKEGYDVVYGVRTKRKGESWFKLATAHLFYRILKKLTSVEIPVDTGDFRLMDRKVVLELSKMKEKARFVRGMVSWIGFKQTKVEYVRSERYAGETKYPFKKMLQFALNGILSFSQTPLKLSSSLGFFSAGVALCLMFYALASKLLGYSVSGWTSVMLAVLFLGGVQLITIGILGEYVGRIYEESKDRPLYVIKEEVNIGNGMEATEMEAIRNVE